MTDAVTDQDQTEATADIESESARPETVDDGGSSWLHRLHPIGWLAVALLVAAALATATSTELLIGNMPWWLWLALLATVAVSAAPTALHGMRLGIEAFADMTGRVAMVLAWIIFGLQLFNVITRYSNSWFETDILFGETVSLAWMSFGALFLLGVNYGVMTGINPRIDFWWTDFSAKRKAWLDFIMHSVFFLPFLIMAIRILKPYAAASLGYNRFANGGEGAWPSGWRVWESWEQSPNAGELPLGPIQAFMFVAFGFWAIQVVAEMIKTGFIIMGREDLAEMAESDVPLRVE